jgi:sugar/nucleoside kinase (ribokinase family)
MSAALQPRRYVAVGHVTVDVLPGGERRPGGGALYSALQASRLGMQATVVTRGQPAEIERLLKPYAGELELIVQPAASTTTLQTSGTGAARRQRVLAWAGLVEVAELPAGEILHLAPVAAELAGTARGEWPFVGLTPQGFARRWERPGGEIEGCAAEPSLALIAGRLDAVVLSESERAHCAALLERSLATGATVAVTAGADATELIDDRGSRRLPVRPLAAPVDDLGAGDVYAAVFFAGLASGEGPDAAARSAHAAAALRMQGAGPAAIADAGRIAAAATAGA